jgi:phosphonate metabolism protein (transferase hexapeptide repeat family)
MKNGKRDPEAEERERGRMEGAPEIDPMAIVQDSTLGRWTAVGARTKITETIFGDYSYIMEDCQIIYSEIGKFCSIASHSRINPSNHPLWRPTSHHFTYRSKFYGFGEDDEEIFQWRRDHKVILGHDVWFGHGATILPGVRIGTGAVVGAGSVVTKDVKPFVIVAGVPPRMIRRRVSEEVGAALMRIAWWDWPHEALANAIDDFRYLDAGAFAAKYDPNNRFTLRRLRGEEEHETAGRVNMSEGERRRMNVPGH